MQFHPYPFEKLRALLGDCANVSEKLNLSIGEPAFGSPESVINTLKENANLIRYYPSLQQGLAKAQRDFVQRRFKVTLKENELIPTFGSREVLFNFPHFIFASQKNIKNNTPILAYPNPFYQIYEGAQIANKAEVIYMPLTKENDFKPYLTKEDLKKVTMVILNSPNNPTGQTLSKEELQEWVKLALQYDFLLINDECYSEIYSNMAPASLLEASIEVGNTEFKNIFVINSISKRLSAPGLRSGFIAGDSAILEEYKIFRTYVGISMPNTLQLASIIAWGEDEYATQIREKFAKNLEIAQEIFYNCKVFPYTFYLWLDVGSKDSKKIPNHLSSDEFFTKELYKTLGYKVLPGSYLGRKECGINHVRIALTQENEKMKHVLQEIKTFFDAF